MIKLFLSTFAMSLFFFVAHANGQNREFLGLEDELLPLLPGEERFSRPDLHQEKDWAVKEQQVILESSPLKGQKFSTIEWKNIDTEKWLDFDIWKNERGIKDQFPDWQRRVRHSNQNEHLGKVLNCRGQCENYRHNNVSKSVHLSRIDEADEFHTLKDSAAWIYLIDGSLVRIGPESSVSFLEINLGSEEVFIHLRLNYGQIFWHPRVNLTNSDPSLPETDIFSIPLMVKEANQEFFERKIFSQQNDTQHLVDSLNLNRTAIDMQLKQLNDLREKNSANPMPATKVFIVSPQVSVISKKASFDLVYLPGHNSYFKRRTSNEGDEFQIALRGYLNTDLISINENAWYSMEKNGRSYELLSEAPPELQLIELLTSRVKTIELAREYWFEKYTSSISKLVFEKNEKELASSYGYVLWKENISKRLSFLLEYSRRIETTYLKALDNLAIKMEKKGEVIGKPLDNRYHVAALNDYLGYLKKRYSIKYSQVREMSDLQYYIWVLKRGSGVIR